MKNESLLLSEIPAATLLFTECLGDRLYCGSSECNIPVPGLTDVLCE